MARRKREQEPKRKICEPCDKKCYRDIGEAIHFALIYSARHGRPLAFYICPTNPRTWHLTSQDWKDHIPCPKPTCPVAPNKGSPIVKMMEATRTRT